MPKIYRVENDYGHGCYTNGDMSFACKHSQQTNTPSPNFDRGIKRWMSHKEICGFLNLEQANKWFTDNELKEAERKGFILKQIEVKEITAIGEKQVLAIR